MPGPENETLARENNRDRLMIRRALRVARGHLRWQLAVRGFAATFPLPVLAAAAWIALARFTLLDLPRWPELLFFVLWLLVYLVWVGRAQIRPSRAAAFLDARLQLDERLTTLLELEGRAKVEGRRPGATRFTEYLIGDAALLLRERLEMLPPPFVMRAGRRHALAFAAAAIVLAGALTVPTSLDLVRSTQSEVKVALEKQADRIADLKAELVQRADLPESLKQGLNSELSALEKSLRAAPTDRAEALAAIADAEERVRNLLQGAASSDYEEITQSSDLFKEAASTIVDSKANRLGEAGDISSAADAAKRIKDTLKDLDNPQIRALTADLQRAASAAANKDPELAQDLLDAAAAVSKRDVAQASAALDSAAKRFEASEKAQQAASAVESTLSRLEDGRQSVAEAGAATTKRGQVGFRRGVAAQAGATGTPVPDAPVDPGNGNMVQALGPAGGASLPPSGGGTGQTGGGAGSQGGSQTGTGGAAQTGGNGQGAPAQGQSGTAGAGSGGGAGTGSQGNNLGRIVGPIRGGGGSANPGGEAEGVGISGGAGTSTGVASNTSQGEKVYVPNQGVNAPAGSVGQAAPAPGQDTISGLPGSSDASPGTSSSSAPGVGMANTIRTPYNEVIGQYAQQATDALEKAYVPPDAKSYVRDYFSSLGK